MVARKVAVTAPATPRPARAVLETVAAGSLHFHQNFARASNGFVFFYWRQAVE
jgi:hypothetical protein